MYKRFKIWDFVIIVSAIALALIFFSFSYSSYGDTVEVAVDGEVYCTYSLFENRSIEIDTGMGNIKVRIKDNEAYIEEADCRDKICLNERHISRKGQTIVCLPLRVIVKIGGSEYEYAY